MNDEATNERARWAQSLKPGDQFAVRSSYGFRSVYVILTVDRLTDTQAIAKHGPLERRMRRRDAQMLGERHARAEPVTPAVHESNRATAAQNWADHYCRDHIKKLPTADILAVKTLVEELAAKSLIVL